MRCPSCNHHNPGDAWFCEECGAKLELICPACKASVSPGARFCKKCGTAIDSTKAAASTALSSPKSQVPVAADAATSEAIDGERKTVTALFADIKGSTELMEDLDPEEARAIIDPALKLMIDAVRRYGGYIVQSTGDGIFALFGAPVAHEDHPQRALYAALRLQEALKRYSAKVVADGSTPIQGRVGINTGEVVVRSIQTGAGQVEYTPIWHTTNLASRMQTAAPVGSIAVSENTHKLCEGYFILKPLGATRVKGVSEPVDVYEVTGLGPLRTRLQHAAELARQGHGQIIAVMAEPGAGKSRLYFEFKATSQSDWMVLETFSISHGKASAYLPVLDLLQSYFQIAGGYDERTRREKVAGRLAMLDPSLEDTRAYLFSLLGIVEGADPLAQMDGQLKKRRTLDAIKRILLRESLNQPLMLILEDLHWIDEQTQELLNLLADSIGTAKILLLVNYRPEYSHHWNSKSYYTQLRLDPLGKESAEEMLSALLGDGKDLIPVKRLIVERTEGTPFFMEEIVQSLFDDGVLQRNRGVKLARSMNALKVPATVQGVRAARIDRLPAEEKELLQTLGVLGREFPFELVRRVTLKPDDDLNRMLCALQLAEFIYEQPPVGDTQYIFKHALTQEVAYNSLLIERRKLLHERAGQALELQFAGQLDDHLAELAHHYGRSANPGKAVEYLTRAGQQALNRSAFAEAQTQLLQGLEWIKKLSEAPERDACELELTSTLAQVLLVTRGQTAPETRAAAQGARDLAEKGGSLAQLVIQVFGIFRSAMAAGDYSTAALLADQILDLAQRESSAASLGLASFAQVWVGFIRGDLAGTEDHFARCGGLLDADGFKEVPAGAVATIGAASLCAGALGHADSARERIAQGLAFARDSNKPFDLEMGRFFESWLYCLLREPQRAELAATQALTIVEEHGFSSIRNLTRTMLGWAWAQRGQPSEGVALIRQGLVDLAETGGRLAITDQLTRMTEARARALDSKIDDALVTIEEALQANPEELVFRPNALTCRGELRLKLGQTELAEADFREAISLAQMMQAKAWELRATISLSRLLASQGRRNEARAMLAAIYGWFTEGFDTGDLKDAKVLLEQL